MDRFISDPHLGHSNIIKFERTRFKIIDEHDTFIKNLIMSEVKPHDTLYVLGDVGELTDENIKFWNDVPGKTILVRGNHDTQKGKLEAAFDVVSDVPIFYNKRILLSHEPLPVTNETLNVHGHLHGAYLNSQNHLNLSIHMANYKIYTAKDLEAIIRAMPKIAQTFMYEWYADKYVFTTAKEDVVRRYGKIDIKATRLKQMNTPGMSRKIQKFQKMLKEQGYSNRESRRAVIDFIMNDYSNNANPTIHDLEKHVY